MKIEWEGGKRYRFLGGKGNQAVVESSDDASDATAIFPITPAGQNISGIGVSTVQFFIRQADPAWLEYQLAGARKYCKVKCGPMRLANKGGRPT